MKVFELEYPGYKSIRARIPRVWNYSRYSWYSTESLLECERKFLTETNRSPPFRAALASGLWLSCKQAPSRGTCIFCLRTNTLSHVWVVRGCYAGYSWTGRGTATGPAPGHAPRACCILVNAPQPGPHGIAPRHLYQLSRALSNVESATRVEARSPSLLRPCACSMDATAHDSSSPASTSLQMAFAVASMHSASSWLFLPHIFSRKASSSNCAIPKGARPVRATRPIN